LNTDVGH